MGPSKQRASREVFQKKNHLRYYATFKNEKI